MSSNKDITSVMLSWLDSQSLVWANMA